MDQPARRVAYGSLNSECRCLKLVDTFRLEPDREFQPGLKLPVNTESDPKLLFVRLDVDVAGSHA